MHIHNPCRVDILRTFLPRVGRKSAANPGLCDHSRVAAVISSASWDLAWIILIYKFKRAD